MNALLPNRTVVVTGAGNGIGPAIAARCAGEGANVALLDVNEEAAIQVADDIGLPDRLLATHADVTRASDGHAAVASIIDRFGRIDSLINNAGISAYFDVGVMTEQQWEDVLGVDLKGAWLCTRAVTAPMRAQRSGSIVNIASIHTKLTSVGMFPYAVAKSGLIGLTHSLALDLAPDGIRINAVSPGWTRTALVQESLDRQADPAAAEAEVLRAHPMGRICTPEEVAAVVAFVASDQASGITGAEIRVDAGRAPDDHCHFRASPGCDITGDRSWPARMRAVMPGCAASRPREARPPQRFDPLLNRIGNARDTPRERLRGHHPHAPRAPLPPAVCSIAVT